MPNTWYHNDSSDKIMYSKEHKIKKYKVLSSEHLDTYHYHGSWFEYDWEIEAINLETNEKETLKICTWRPYSELNGKIIEYDGQRFTVVE